MSRVIVIGSINMDVVARSDRLPKPGETVLGSNLNHYPGGKGANQAVAAAKAGSSTIMVGALGNDESAQVLRDYLNSNHVDTTWIEEISEEITGTALIMVDERGENEIVVVPGANERIGKASVENVPIEPGDIVICQLEIPTQTVNLALQRGREHGAKTILNPAPAMSLSEDMLSLADVLILNETELSYLSGLDVGSDTPWDTLNKAVARIRNSSGKQVVVVTLGPKGVVGFEDNEAISLDGHRVDAIDTTAAGDCFIGSLGACLADGSGLKDALRYANTAASICVQRRGAGPSMPTRDEVVAMLSLTQ